MKNILILASITLLLIFHTYYSCASSNQRNNISKPNKLIRELSPSPSDILELAEHYRKYYTNRNKCIQRGYSYEKCSKISLLCEIKEYLISKAYPSWVGSLKFFDSFKIDCGSGECYQCCYTGDGCHSSFIGYPVLNCNTNYGPETRAAGLTLVIDDNIEPGQACLFTPQTCAHIPLCHYYQDNSAEIEDLEQRLLNGEDHPMNRERSINQRARVFAEWTQNHLNDYLNEFSTEKSSLQEINDFITGRGCKEWKSNITSVDWTDEIFAVKDENNQIIEPASHLNGLQQLTLLRVLASIPNLHGRLSYVDSRVWTDSSKYAYLSRIGDPDEELLKYMSPHALEIFKRVPVTQDYRLLAVPIPDEKKSNTLFNGCELGTPPIVKTAFTQVDESGGVLQVVLEDQDSMSTDNPVLIDWGDGAVTHHILPKGQSSLNISHSYAAAGKYLIYAVVENVSGLRGIGGVVVETTANTASNPPPSVPSISRVILNDLTVTYPLFATFHPGDMFFEVEIEDEQGHRYPVGLSDSHAIDSREVISYGNIVGHNPGRIPVRKIIITRNITPDFRTNGFFADSYYIIPKLIFDIYATATDDFISHSVNISPDMLQIFPTDINTPIPTDQLTLDSNGDIKIPLMKRINGEDSWFDRIEISVTSKMFLTLSIPSVSSDYKAGDSGSWSEIRPGYLVSSEDKKSFSPSIYMLLNQPSRNK